MYTLENLFSLHTVKSALGLHEAHIISLENHNAFVLFEKPKISFHNTKKDGQLRSMQKEILYDWVNLKSFWMLHSSAQGS